jgi:hypothetical protein
MISKSTLGAIAFVAAAGLASPAFAQLPTNAIGGGPLLIPVANYSAGANGGGSAGYNHKLSTDYKLKHHANSHDQTQHR